MPLEPKRHCGKPGHAAYLGRRCPACERERDSLRGTSSSRGYDKDWRKFRSDFLRNNPRCVVVGCGELATDVDHIIGINEGGARLDVGNCRAMCHRHHSQRTGRDQVRVGRK